MLSISERSTVEEASADLLGYALCPEHWVAPGTPGEATPLSSADYQRKVGRLRVCAAVEIKDDLKVLLKVSFRAPQLNPSLAADHLEEFLRDRLPLVPNSEWLVEVDSNRWIHFSRRYAAASLEA